jgi:5'-3' exonuclease
VSPDQPRIKRLHLLDATFELFRAYFAVPSMRDRAGAEVGAVRGLIASTLTLLRQPEVTHLAAATDHVIESFRNRLFAGYKTGDGLPTDLLEQFPLAEEALEALGVVVWPMVEFEADDALATAAARFRARVEQVVILSPDKDLAQCVADGQVVMHDRLRDVTYDEDAVRAKFGVPPASIPDLLALVGDSADGIPGLPGWGMKSAARVLARFGHLETIPADPAAWPRDVRGRERLATILAENRAAALLYRSLATLRTDVPLAAEISDLEWKGVPRRRYLSFCHRHGLEELAKRPTVWLDGDDGDPTAQGPDHDR